jgi:Tol biopolymer transport system component/DNA-binding winged helix-turn-helix (wHTH) protein
LVNCSKTMINGESKQIISFAEFELDAPRRCLMREGKILSLNAKAFDLLVYLAENAGRIVSKNEILDAVWENQFVEEANLKVQMSALRKVLGDRKDAPRFLVTIPGKGYKFIADVNNDDREIVIESHKFSRLVVEEMTEPFIITNGFSKVESQISRVGRNNESEISDFRLQIKDGKAKSKYRLFIVGGIIVIAVLGLSGFWFFNRNQKNSSIAPFGAVEKQLNIKRLTNKGTVNNCVLSPDGKFFVCSFGERGSYRSSLWLGQTSGNSDVQLRPADDLVYYPRSISADGNWLYFTSSDPRDFNNGTLYKMPVLGGVPQKLLSGISVYAVLSPDENQVAFVRKNSETKTSALVIANLDNLGEREIAALPAAQSIITSSLSWSSDGALVAFGAASGQNKDQEIFTANTVSGDVKQVTSLEWITISRLEWLKDGSGLVAVARDKKSFAANQLWQIDYETGKAQKITRDLQHYGSTLSLSADSNTLIAIQGGLESNIWIAPAENLAEAKQITFGSSGNEGWFGIDWTADGKIIYTARIDQSLTLWTIDALGVNAKQITSAGFLDEKPTATADGKYIVFQSNRSGATEIWRMNSAGADLQQLTTSGKNTLPHTTPDSKMIVFTHESEDTNSAWHVSIEGGEATKIIDAECYNARVSPDGNLIACGYQSEGKTKLAIVPITGGAPTKLFDVPPTYNFDGSIRWTRDGRFICYRDWANGLWSQAVEGGAPKLLKGLPEEKLYQYDWSPNGKQLAFVRGRALRDVVLITDFR